MADNKITVTLTAKNDLSGSLSSAGRELQEFASQADKIGSRFEAAGLRIGAMGLAANAGLSRLGLDLKSVVESSIDAQKALFGIASTAGINGAAAEALAGKWGNALDQIAKQTNQTKSQLITAFQDMVAKGISEQDALKMLAPIGKAATATTSSIRDIAVTVSASFSKMEIGGDRVAKVLDVMAAAGDAGAFELKDMAQYMDMLTAKSASLGAKGEASMTQLAAAAQVARMGTGDAASAANNLANWLDKLNASSTANTFKDIGVDLEKLKGNARQSGDFIGYMISEIKKITGGDTAKIAKLFPDVQAGSFAQIATQNFKEYVDIAQKAGQATGVVNEKFDTMMRTTSAKLDSVQINLASAIEGSKVVQGLLSSLDGLGKWASEHPEIAGFIGIGAASTAAVGLVGGAVVAGIGATIKALISLKSVAVGFVGFAAANPAVAVLFGLAVGAPYYKNRVNQRLGTTGIPDYDSTPDPAANLPERYRQRQILRDEQAKAFAASGYTSTGLSSRKDINSAATPPKDAQVQAAAENAPLRIVYGQQRLGAQVANVLVYQNQLIVHAVWCEGPIDSIVSVAMNDEVLPAGVTATHYTGASGQTANATLIAAFATLGITYADALPGIAYSVFQIPATASDGFPNFAAVLKGRKVYDPRTLTTAWSDNPALCLADFIESSSYGLDRTTDSTSVGDAADECDAVVGTAARRSLNLVLESVATSRQHMEALRAYAGCWIVESGGNLKLVPDRPRATDHTVTASGILAGSLQLSRRGVQEVPTVIDVRWTDTSVTPWVERSAVAYAAGVLAGTTPRRESQISLPGIHLYSQAYREAVERLNHFTLEDLEVEWTGFDAASAIEPGHVVALTHPIGLTAKTVRVTEVASISAGRYRIKAREYDPAAYTDIVVSEPTFADTSLPNPVTAPTVTGLVLLEEIYQNANGIWTSRIKAQWDAVDFPFLRHYRVEVYLLGNLVHSAVTAGVLYRTPPVQDLVTYVVKVAAVSMVGSVGTAAEENVYIDGKYLPPSDVPSVSVFEAGGRVYAQWDPATDADIWRYEVRYGPTAGSWETATLIDRVDALRLVTDLIPVGTWKIYVKALDSVGLYSSIAASQTFTVTSDAAAFLVESVDSDTPTLTNMAEYDIFDGKRHWVSEDNVPWNTKYSANMDTYTDPLATYHSSMTSEWLGESEDFAMLLSGQWTGTADVAAVSGSIASSIGFSSDGSAWSYLSGLSHKENARFARLKHEALTTSTLKVTVPVQKIRLDAIPRDEVGAGTSSALGPVTITLENQYVAVKRLTVTPEGTTARMGVVDNIVLGNPTMFDVYVFDAAGNLIASDFRWLFQGV